MARDPRNLTALDMMRIIEGPSLSPPSQESTVSATGVRRNEIRADYTVPRPLRSGELEQRLRVDICRDGETEPG